MEIMFTLQTGIRRGICLQLDKASAPNAGEPLFRKRLDLSGWSLRIGIDAARSMRPSIGTALLLLCLLAAGAIFNAWVPHSAHQALTARATAALRAVLPHNRTWVSAPPCVDVRYHLSQIVSQARQMHAARRSCAEVLC